jgi:methyltransferase-like protein/SAM-dependent methyltransferase
VALYDDYLYDSFPVCESHPDRLAGVAALFGVRPALPSRCRVLELGCGLGGNIVPLAAAYPESSFVGVDQSSRQIEVAAAEARALGLQNIELLAADILDLDDAIGSFDYVLCHGVYSWVPRAVQEKILQICGERLNPNGVAFVSYNTLPGWHMRGMLRDMLRLEVGPEGTPEERVARAREFLGLFADMPKDGGSLAQRWLKSEVDLLGRLSGKYVFYEHLVEQNEPRYFRQFNEEAERAGLRYLGDAHFWTMVPERLGSEAAARIASAARGIVETEQYLDFLDPRLFRRSLLVRAETVVDRDVSWRRLRDVWVQGAVTAESPAASLEPSVEESFTTSGGATLSASAPLLKAALRILAEQRPRGRRFTDLVAEARARVAAFEGQVDGAAAREATDADCEALGANLLGLYAQGYLDFCGDAPTYAIAPGERPCANPLARLQASRHQRECTNFRHETAIVDTFDVSILRRADGTRTREELLDGVLEDVAAGSLVVEINDEPATEREALRPVLEHKLDALARQALFRS